MAIIPQEKLKRKLPPLPGLSKTPNTVTPPPPPLTTPSPVTTPKTISTPPASTPPSLLPTPIAKNSMWSKTKEFLNTIPKIGEAFGKTVADVLVGDVEKTGISGIGKHFWENVEAPLIKLPAKVGSSVVQTAINPSGSEDKSFDLPLLGKVTTYKQDWLPRIDEIVEGKRPLWHVLPMFAEVALDVSMTGSLLDTGAKYVMKKIPVNEPQVAASINKMGLTDLSPETQKKQFWKLSKAIPEESPGIKNTLLQKELNNANEILTKAREQGMLVENPKGIAKAMRDLAEAGTSDVKNLFRMKQSAPYLNIKGLLPEQAGTIPEPAYKPFRQPAFGLSIKEIGGKPIVPAQSEPLQRALASFQKNLYMQVGHYTKEGESIIKGLDLSTVASVDEAANLAIASLPPKIAKDPVIIDSISNWKNSAKQIQQFREETVKPVSAAIKKSVAKNKVKIVSSEENFAKEAKNYDSPEELRNAIDSIIEKGKAYIQSKGGYMAEFNKEKFAKTLNPKDKALYEAGKDLPKNIDLNKIWNQAHKKTSDTAKISTSISNLLEKGRVAENNYREWLSKQPDALKKIEKIQEQARTIPNEKSKKTFLKNAKSSLDREFLKKYKPITFYRGGGTGKSNPLIQEAKKIKVYSGYNESSVVKNGPSVNNKLGSGRYFSEDSGYAKRYAGVNGKIQEITISSEKMYDLDKNGADWSAKVRQEFNKLASGKNITEGGKEWAKLRGQAKDIVNKEIQTQGYDGLSITTNGKKQYNIFQSLPKKQYTVPKITDEKTKEIAKLIKVLSKPPKTPPITPSSINKMINPPSPLVTKSEDFLLRKKMKDMKRGNVLGYQAGTTDTRIRIYDKLRIKMAEMKDVKDQIIGYVKETIPPKDRGRFLNMVANAKTQRNLVKSFVRIDKVAEAVQKKTVVAEITKKLKDIENSGKISVEYKPIIKKMVEDIELKGHTSGKIEELKATREFIEREIAKGNDVTMPQYVLDSLKILDRKPLKDLSLSELQVISDKIDVLRQLGETKLASKENLDNLIKEKWTKELSQGTFPLEKNPLLSPKLRHLTLWEKVKNSIARGRNAKIDIDYALTDPEVLADMLDGNAHYLGPNYRIFFKPQSINYGNYLQGRVNFHDTVIGLLKKNGINDVDLFGERLFIELNKHQKGGIEKLLENGYSQAQIDSVNLTPGETNIYNFVREYYDNAGKRAESFIQKTYNKEFKLQENYSPWWTDYKAMSESIDPATSKAPEVWEKFANPIEYRPPKKTVEFGWMKSRTGGKNIIKHNAIEDLLKHNDDLEYMTNMGADTKRLFEIANSPAYAEMAGKEGQSRMITWLNSIARKGGSIGETQTGWIDTARSAVGAGSMALKLSTVLIQFTSLFDAATQIGPWAFKGMIRFATSKEARDFLYKNAPEWKARFGKEYAMSEFSTNKLLAKYQQMGYKPMAKADSFTAGSSLLGAYEKYLVEHGLPLDFTTVNKDAMYEAQRIMRRTQGTGEFIYQPPEIVHGVLTKNRSLSKAIWQFQSFNLTGRWNYIKHDLWVYGIKEKNPKVAVNMLFWLTVAAFAGVGMRQLAKRATGGEPNPEDTLTSSTAQELLQTIPFVSMITSMGKFKGEPVPILDIPRQVFTATDQIGGKAPETRRKGYIKLIEVLGKASGVPGASQAGEIARNLTGTTSSAKKSSSLPTLPGLKKSTKTKRKGLPKLKKIKR